MKLLLLCLLAVVQCSDLEAGQNPIRRVVTLLQNMVKKVEQEADKNEELHKKFMCYCKNGKGELEKSIAEAEVRGPELGSAIEELKSQKVQLTADLKTHATDREGAKSSIKDATGIREKEAKEHAAYAAEAKTNIKALKGAIDAITKGTAGFLQTTTAQTVKKIIINRQDMADVDRDDALSFFSADKNALYNPSSGAILGILKQIHDDMEKELNERTEEEKNKVTDYESTVSSKNKEIGALSTAIENKQVRKGQTAVKITEMQGSLSDSEAALINDKKFLADLDKNCATKQEEYDNNKKLRAEELIALHDTIKILNDDDALDLFKKTLPSASSLLQVAGTRRQDRALTILKKISKPSLGVDFISLALKGKKIGFEKVIKMIDEMVGTLKQEQIDDDVKRDYCQKELDKSEDKKKMLDIKIADLETSMADTQDGMEKSKEQITQLTKSIKDLDKSVAEASDQRKEEHTAFVELMQSNHAAKELLGLAKNRLNKFYNPKLHVAETTPQPTEQERIANNMNSFVQIRAHRGDEAPKEPPKTFGAFKAKTEESNGVLAMIDLLIKDLDKETTEAETEERHSQEEYEETMSDSANKRAQDSKTLSDTQSALANLEGDLQNAKDSHASSTKEAMATHEYVASLHAECDWNLKYYDERKEARSGEIDSLNNAKAVLSGADFSLVQTSLRGARQQ